MNGWMMLMLMKCKCKCGSQTPGVLQMWYEKVQAVVYLVPSDTRVSEIYLLKKIKILHDEFLYDKAWIPTRAKYDI